MFASSAILPRRHLAYSTVTLLGLAAACPCAAQPSVHWVAPEGCPDQHAFQAALDERFAQSATLDAFVHIDAVLKRVTPNAFAISLSVHRREGHVVALRRLSAASCSELLPAAVWLLGLSGVEGTVPEPSEPSQYADESAPPNRRTANDGSEGPSASARQDQTRPGTRGAQDPHNQRSTEREVAAASASQQPGVANYRPPKQPVPWHVRISGIAGVFAGAGVAVQGTVGAATSLSVGPLHTQLSGSALLPAERSIAQSGHVQLWSFEVRLSECALWGKYLQGGPCIGVALLRTAAHAHDFGHDARRVLLWGSAEAGILLLLPVAKGLELTVAGAVGTPITPRPSFTVDRVGAVATASRWSQEARLGLNYVIR